MSTYKTIQVTPKEYELLVKLHERIMKIGTRSIEETLRDKTFHVDKIMKDMERNSLAKGAVAGIAIAFVLHMLECKRKGK